MKIKNKLATILVFFTLISTSILANSKSDNIEMPKLELYDQNGKKHNLSDYKGKVVFLNFYATWCHYCNQEIAHINKLYKEFGENKQDVIFLGVAAPKSKENRRNADVTKDKVLTHMKKKEIIYPILFDETGETLKKYGIKYFPMNFIVNKQGYLEGYAGGAISENDMRKIINDAIK